MPIFQKSWLAAAMAVAVVVMMCKRICIFARATSGSISGTVLDPSGAVVARRQRLKFINPVSGYDRSTTTDSKGNFSFANVPYNPYHMKVTATGFARPRKTSRSVRWFQLSVKVTSAGDRRRSDNGDRRSRRRSGRERSHFSYRRGQGLVRQASAGKPIFFGQFAGHTGDAREWPRIRTACFTDLGDHAENSFSVDGQPITDQQSKVFSNQIPLDSIQSLEVIRGAPPAEYGGKTSLIIIVDHALRPGHDNTPWRA